MIRNQRNAGFTLIELMIVVAIIAIIAAVAIPKLMSARISANENAAIATLRSIAAAQQQLQSSAAIDTDGDGGGEFGYFAELAGTLPLRIFDGAAPAMGAAPADVLDPPILATAFGNIVTAPTGGVVERQGYFYQIWLPGPSVAGVTTGFAEDPAPGGATAVLGSLDSANCEILWACYAWPVDAEKTGNRVFMINQEGDPIAYDNRDQEYEGIAAAANVPTFAAAYSDVTANNMDENLGLAVMGLTANDGNIWTTVGN